MKNALYELDSINVYKSRGKYVVYDLADVPPSEVIIIKMLVNVDDIEIEKLNQEIGNALKRPCLIINKDVEFFILKKLSWWKGIKLWIRRITGKL